jgi:hypothetical protein
MLHKMKNMQRRKHYQILHRMKNNVEKEALSDVA